MKTALVSTTGGTAVCQSKAELAGLIRQGAALPQGEELWVSDEREQYPCLSILIKGENACVHYFQNEEGETWQSCGDFDEEVLFIAGGEEWLSPEDVIIPLEQAVCCAEAFWDTGERPGCIEWDAL